MQMNAVYMLCPHTRCLTFGIDSNLHCALVNGISEGTERVLLACQIHHSAAIFVIRQKATFLQGSEF